MSAWRLESRALSSDSGPKRLPEPAAFVITDPGCSTICRVLFSRILVGLMFFASEGASVRAERDSSQEGEKLLRTNPILGLQKYKVLQLDLSGTTVDEQFYAIDEAGIAGGEEKSDRRDLLRASHLAAWNLGFEELLSVVS
jgi:hypothetical protein